MFSRLNLLIGDKVNDLHNKKVIVFGIGGVGGYATEILARCGIGNITLVDYDKVDISNKNRQIIALDSTIGLYKVDVMKDRILDFYPDCNVISINEKVLPDNLENFNLSNYDYVIDAIDMVSSKVSLISYCKSNSIPIISAMGVGNRLGIPNFKIVDIYKTCNDKLAKVLRKELKEVGVTSHNVVFCENIPSVSSKTIGSIAYFPAMSGCMLASYVVEELIKE